jgi:hypothetical protein
MTYYQVEFLTGKNPPYRPKRFRTEEKAKQHARKVLGISDESGLASKATILPVSSKQMQL